MARHTRIKLAALATTFVAALGIVAISPATGADAGTARITAQGRSHRLLLIPARRCTPARTFGRVRRPGGRRALR